MRTMSVLDEHLENDRVWQGPTTRGSLTGQEHDLPSRVPLVAMNPAITLDDLRNDRQKVNPLSTSGASLADSPAAEEEDIWPARIRARAMCVSIFPRGMTKQTAQTTSANDSFALLLRIA